MKFPPYGRGGRFYLLLLQRAVVILYSLFLTFIHIYLASSTAVALFFEAHHPKLVAAVMASAALLHIYGMIMMFLPYDILTKKIDEFMERQNQRRPSNDSGKSSDLLLQGVTKVVEIWDAYFSDTGVLGRRGRHFEVRLLMREAIETPVQTFKAILLSQRIPNPLWVQLYAWVIITECIFVPLIMGVNYVKSLKRRNMMILLDTFVDLSLGAIIPVSACAVQVIQYFQNPIMATDRPFTGELISTTKFIVVGSNFDLVATLLPIIFLHFLITTAHENWTDIEANVDVLESSDVAKKNSIVPEGLNNILLKTFKVSSQRWKKCWVFTKVVMAISSVIWGFGLILLLLRQGNTQCENIPSCVTPLQPLSSIQTDNMELDCACLIVTLHCNKLNNTLEEELLKFNPNYPVAMDLSSCPNATSLPKILESFTRLIFLELEDFQGISTLEFNFTKLSRLLVLRISNFSGISQIPETLKALPSTLKKIKMSDMEQLKVIPTWVASHWKQLSRLYLERIGLVGFPIPILELGNLAVLSLNGNPSVSVIPPQVENFKLLEVLSLTNTNISRLPPAVWSLEQLSSVSVGQNNIATLEDLGSVQLLNRIQSWPSTYSSLITLTGNPLCQNYKEELSAHPDACATECAPGCAPRLEMDYKCDEECNTESCGFDRGFCKI